MINPNGDLIAVMANTVAEARHMLTVPEQRLILWLVAQIDREDDCLKEHSLSVLEFEQILGSNSGSLYERMEEACDRLQTRVLELHAGPGRRRKFNWMHRVEYLDSEGKITLRFHEDLAPVLLRLRERFCQIPLKSVFKLRSGYAIRWLEMLHSRKHQGAFYMSVEELRDWLHIEPDELNKPFNLWSRAIDYPRKDLDGKSPLTFQEKARKIGRTVIGWTFTVVENKPKPAAKTRKARAPKVPVPAPALVDKAIMADLSAFKASLARGTAIPTAP